MFIPYDDWLYDDIPRVVSSILDDVQYKADTATQSPIDDIEQSLNSLGFDLDTIAGDAKATIEQLVAANAWNADSAERLMQYLIDDSLSEAEALVLLVEADLAGLIDMTLEELKDLASIENKAIQDAIITTIEDEPELPPEIEGAGLLSPLAPILSSVVDNVAFRLERFIGNAFGAGSEG